MKYIKRIIGQFSANRLVEPFVGSGTLFLNTFYQAYLLCDINEDIINLYKNLMLYKKEFIDYAKSFFTSENNQPAKYYYFRDLFNETKDDVLKSALLLYLNRHGYNGLVRYNKEGKFNVPFGRYEKPYFPEKEMLFFIDKCEKVKVEFKVQDFRKTFKEIASGDVVYCDPPYVPLSDTSNFTSYSKEKFGLEDQKDLVECAKRASKEGIPVIISNHNSSFVMENYKTKILKLEVRRSISCKERNKIEEIVAVFY